MDAFQQILNVLEAQAKSTSTNSNKRKWREIEELKDKFQLEKELRSYENSLESMLNEFT